MTYRVHLVHPSLEKNGAYTGCEGPRIAPVGLPTIASLLPDDFEVKITDERVEDLDLDVQSDLVGITSSSRVISRAYRIADQFRERGIPVIMGGLHASAVPEEVSRHCDAVVIGEAEGALPRLVQRLPAGSSPEVLQSVSTSEAGQTPPSAPRSPGG